MNKEFLYMQKLAGIITEGEYKEKLQALREDAFGSNKAIPLSKIPDAAAKAALDGGKKDQDDKDDVANAGKASVAVGSLKPMQKEVIPQKALSFALGFADTGTTPDLNNMEAITSADGYIMDGHHRWAARTLLNPGASVKVEKVDMPADDVVTALNVYTKAKGLKGNPGKGDVSQFATLIPKTIDTFVSQGTDQWPMSEKKPEEIKAIIAKIGGGDFEKGKATLIANAKKLPTDIHPNAPSRIDMPVIDAGKGDLDAVLNKLKAGELDFKEPFSPETKAAMKEFLYMQKLAGIITEGEYKENIMKRKITKKQLQELIKEEVVALNEKEETVKAKVEDEAAKKIESDPSARKEAEKSLPELAKKLNLSIEDLADSKKVEMALMKSGVADKINEAVGHTDWDHSSEYGDSSLKPYWKKKARADREDAANRRDLERKRSRNSSDYNKATGMKRIGAILGIGGLTTSIGGVALGALSVISPVAGLAALIAGAATGLIGGSKYRKGDDIQSKLRMGESTDNKNIKITKRELREMIRELLEEGLL